MKTLIISVALLLTVANKGEEKLIGRWQSKPSEKGNVTSVIFKADNSFEGFVNKKPFVTGTYTLNDSIFTMTDNGCSGINSTYKIVFFSNEDSIRFRYVEDSCIGRRKGMSTLVLGRVK